MCSIFASTTTVFLFILLFPSLSYIFNSIVRNSIYYFKLYQFLRNKFIIATFFILPYSGYNVHYNVLFYATNFDTNLAMPWVCNNDNQSIQFHLCANLYFLRIVYLLEKYETYITICYFTRHISTIISQCVECVKKITARRGCVLKESYIIIV